MFLNQKGIRLYLTSRPLQLLTNVHFEAYKDKAVWKLEKDGIFTVKYFYDYLTNRVGEGVRFPTLQIRKVKAVPKIAFFAWEADQECIIIIDKLIRRGHIMVNRCYLCKEVVESCNHLLWCLVTYNIWNMVYSFLGINWVIGGAVKNEFWIWDGLERILKL